MLGKLKKPDISDTFFENTKIVNGELYFLGKFCECIKYIKTFFQFSDLDKIELVNNDEYEDKFNVQFYSEDIRVFIKNTSTIYDVVFLDGFTPSKCPCIWSLDLFQRLFECLNDNGLLVTYNTSAPVRNAMLIVGLNIGNIYKNNKIIGTIASKNENYINNKLSEYDLGLLDTKAGIPYRDLYLNDDNTKILLNRKYDFENSSLESSSRYIKRCKNEI